MKMLIAAGLVVCLLCGCSAMTAVKDVVTNSYTVSDGAHLTDLFSGTSSGSEARDKEADKYYWVLENATLDDYVLARDTLIDIGFTEEAVRDEIFDYSKSYIAEKDGYYCYLLWSFESVQAIFVTTDIYNDVFGDKEVESNG